MAAALALARKGEGQTRPNPPVGAVLVKRGAVVGDGYHHRAGAAHAEVLAIRKAGDAARDATLYVTLEPCSTFGRTPPCTDLVRSSGIARVVVGVPDPNPKHVGRCEPACAFSGGPGLPSTREFWRMRRRISSGPSPNGSRLAARC